MTKISLIANMADWIADAMVTGQPDDPIDTHNATTFSFVSDLGYKVTWHGSGFSYDANQVGIGGTVSSITVEKAGEVLAQITDLDASMQRIYKYSIGIDRGYALGSGLLPIFSDASDLHHYMMRGDDLVQGSAGQDELVGYIGNDSLFGGANDDIIYADAGNDLLIGGAGSDILSMTDANDDASITRGFSLDAVTFVMKDAWGGTDVVKGFEIYRDSAFADTLKGSGAGEDFFLSQGNDVVDGRGGVDMVSYARTDRLGANQGVYVNLTTGIAIDAWAGTDRLTSIEVVQDSWMNDIVIGSDGNNTFFINEGVDRLDGRGGKDTVQFGTVSGYTYSKHGVSVDLTFAAIVRDDGYGHIETITNVEVFSGTKLADSFIGASGSDNFVGQFGNDTLVGGGGADTLAGGVGQDKIDGGSGNDILYGGVGNDVLEGGSGADDFYFGSLTTAGNGVDSFVDMQTGVDQIHLSRAWAGDLIGAGLTAAQFRSGTGAATALNVMQRMIYNTTTGDLYFDKDGAGGAAAVKIAVFGNHAALSYHDFLVY